MYLNPTHRVANKLLSLSLSLSLSHIITDNLCDVAGIKAKVGCFFGRSNILLRKFYFCSERVKNRLFSSYCSNLYLCSLWANYRKSSISRFNVSYNNAFRILHNLHMRCSVSSMFANAAVDSCSTVRCIPLLNYIKYGLRCYTGNANFLSFYNGQNVFLYLQV